MEKSMADQFLEQQQAAQEQQQNSEAEKGEAEKGKDRDYQPEHIIPPQEQQQTRTVDLDGSSIRSNDAKIDERQAGEMQHHLQDQLPEMSGAEIENTRSIGDAEAGRLSASQQHEQEQEELER